MKTKSNVETATKARITELAQKVGQMHQRTLAAAAPLKARYAELREQMKMLELEIRALDEDWELPK